MRVIVPAAVLLGGGALLWGRERLAYDPPEMQTLKVGMISSDAFVKDPDAQRNLIHGYADRAARLADGGAKLILIPEKITVIKSIPARGDRCGVWQRGQARRDCRCWARALDSRGEAQRGARLSGFDWRGRSIRTRSTTCCLRWRVICWVGSARVNLPGNEGVEICLRTWTFPELSRDYAHDGAALLIVPAWDFHSDGWLHDRMAVVRGVESGFSLIRNAKEGLLTVSDTRGRVTAEQHSDAAQFAELVADAHAAHVSTFYAQWGDWFAYVCVGGLVLLLAASRFVR